MTNFWYFFIVLYVLYWFSQWGSHVICKLDHPISHKLRKYVWNGRIDLFQRPIYRKLLEAMEEKRYWPAAGLVILSNTLKFGGRKVWGSRLNIKHNFLLS